MIGLLINCKVLHSFIFCTKKVLYRIRNCYSIVSLKEPLASPFFKIVKKAKSGNTKCWSNESSCCSLSATLTMIFYAPHQITTGIYCEVLLVVVLSIVSCLRSISTDIFWQIDIVNLKAHKATLDWFSYEPPATGWSKCSSL